jgi:hypothetical protein
MLSIGLWRWYINVTIGVLDIIHCPVFLKNSTLYIRTSKETHCLRYKTKKLMVSIGLWRLYVTVRILDIIHRVLNKRHDDG